MRYVKRNTRTRFANGPVRERPWKVGLPGGSLRRKVHGRVRKPLFFRRPLTLRPIQARAALLWVVYGMAIDPAPVVVANLIVAGAVLYSSFARRPTEGSSELDQRPPPATLPRAPNANRAFPLFRKCSIRLVGRQGLEPWTR